MSRYRFIAAEKANYPVSLLCRVLGVSRASFYAWAGRGPSARERADQQLTERIRQIHRDSRGTYGAHGSMPSCTRITASAAAASGWPGCCASTAWSAATAAGGAA